MLKVQVLHLEAIHISEWSQKSLNEWYRIIDRLLDVSPNERVQLKRGLKKLDKDLAEWLQEEARVIYSHKPVIGGVTLVLNEGVNVDRVAHDIMSEFSKGAEFKLAIGLQHLEFARFEDDDDITILCNPVIWVGTPEDTYFGFECEYDVEDFDLAGWTEGTARDVIARFEDAVRVKDEARAKVIARRNEMGR